MSPFSFFFNIIYATFRSPITSFQIIVGKDFGWSDMSLFVVIACSLDMHLLNSCFLGFFFIISVSITPWSQMIWGYFTGQGILKIIETVEHLSHWARHFKKNQNCRASESLGKTKKIEMHLEKNLSTKIVSTCFSIYIVDLS